MKARWCLLGSRSGCAAYPMTGPRKTLFSTGGSCFPGHNPTHQAWLGFSKVQEEVPHDEYWMGMKSQVPPLRDGSNNDVYFAGLFASPSLPPLTGSRYADPNLLELELNSK